MGNEASGWRCPALYCGIMKEAIPVMATTMTIGAETRPADVAACPMTSAPTMLTAAPTCLGNRTPASRSASNEYFHQERFHERRKRDIFPGFRDAEQQGGRHHLLVERKNRDV